MTEKINERPGSRGCANVTRLSSFLRSPFGYHYSMCLHTTQYTHQKSIVRLSSKYYPIIVATRYAFNACGTTCLHQSVSGISATCSLCFSPLLCSPFLYVSFIHRSRSPKKGSVLSAVVLSLVLIFMLTLHGLILFGLRFSPFYTLHQLSGP
ncbi:hypothetical protein IW261DRAFT_1520149 [Armillaria novae-zelandiae]|uniref:Uncharacterized protein n=1 Tax=Armillaria novae-zelandiae TaxID=153914 RepID=A0AA39NL30_9AGAR|nr:hypothetical protein IW261DRAFT_1520149 [Armillaria novae-zelandiae]